VKKPHEYDFKRLGDLPSCPPPSAVSVDGRFFAFHASEKPDGGDFLTASQRNVFPHGDECKRRSNSVFDDLTAIKKLCDGLRRRGRGLTCKYISSGRILEENGVVLPDRSHHFSFWVCGTTSMHAIFKELVS
jgi:hypothetical protein